MSLLVIFGLFLQTVAVGLVLMRTRNRPLAYTGTLFVLMSFLYHGATEVMQALFPGMNLYRDMVSQSVIDKWVVLFSLAILIFALVYCLRLRPISRQSEGAAKSPELIDWRLGAALVVPAYVMTLTGLGKSTLGYWTAGLISEFLGIIVILTLLAFLFKFGSRYLVPTLLVLVIVGSLIGGRYAVIISSLVLLACLYRYKFTIPKKHLAVLIIIGILGVFIISAMRAEVGRFTFSAQTYGERIRSLAIGLQNLLNQGLSPKVLEDFVYRFDGNAFSGMVYLAFEAGYKPTGPTPLLHNFDLAIPSFLNPYKLTGDIYQLNEENYIVRHFDIREEWNPGYMIDYIPTVWGILFAAWGRGGLLVVAIILGWFYAVADNWLLRSHTLIAVLVGIGLTITTLTLEVGVRAYILTARNIAALFLCLAMLRGFLKLLCQMGRAGRINKAVTLSR